MTTYKVVTHHLQELTWEVEADSPEQAESHRGFQLCKKFKHEWHRKQRGTASKSA